MPWTAFMNSSSGLRGEREGLSPDSAEHNAHPQFGGFRIRCPALDPRGKRPLCLVSEAWTFKGYPLPARCLDAQATNPVLGDS